MISHYTLGCKNSHRFHRSAQMLIALFSHRTHRTFCYKNLCKSVKSVGVFLSKKFLCVLRILWEIISTEGSVYSANSVGDYYQQKVLWVLRILWEIFSVGAWVWQGCHTLLQYICGKRKIISLTRHSG